MEKLLEDLVRRSHGWTEARYQERRSLILSVRSGHFEQCSSIRTSGAGIRALAGGAFGFASTTDLSERGLAAAVTSARALAEAATERKRNRSLRLAPAAPTRGTFPVATADPLDAHSLEEKIDLVLKLDERVRRASPHVVSSSVTYAETLDERIIATSEGTLARVLDAKPSLRVLAVVSSGGEQSMGLETVGVTGGWAELLARRSPDLLVAEAVRIAVDQLSAPYATGGPATVVLDPELVGTLCHEAIGHTVEADIVLGGAITAGKIGTPVASELVTMCDSGLPVYGQHAVGLLPVDDEGVRAGRTVLVESGILRSYLHNRETATLYNVAPTGNARAFLFSDDPIIRMTNTYIEPGETPVAALLEGVHDGYYLRGFAMSGQADSNAEFMFGVREALRGHHGRVAGPVRGVTISGNAFEVLRSVDGVGDDFSWENGAGVCGKGQPAKVDAGGPHIRCRITLGGRQA
ncbi:MAG: TldD/PmbA family protein [Candidatus Bipolaricaulota bacterium]|nr:TldD/PmbA family protein [Candidatus Bipolaricaulota bacterium]